MEEAMRVRVLRMGSAPLREGAPDSTLVSRLSSRRLPAQVKSVHVCAIRAHGKMLATCNLGSELSPGTRLARTLTLDFSASRTVRK